MAHSHKKYPVTEDRNDPCGNDVRRCLSGRSGHRFLDATKLRSVARSNEFMPIDMEVRSET